MAGGEVIAGPRRQAGQVHHLLGDPIARVVEDFLAGLGQFGIGGLGADHDAVAPRLGHRLHHQLVHAVQHLGPLVFLPQQVGVGIGDDRLLAQVVPDHVGHIGVHGLVVAHPVAHRVGNRHRAGPGGGHQAGHSQGGLGVEHHRIQEGVVDAAVDHVHPLQPPGGAHGHNVVVHHQITALHQLHAHAAGQKGVLEVGRVEDAGGEHCHGGIVAAGRWGDGPQGPQQRTPVVVYRADRQIGEGGGEEFGHGGPVLDHIGDAAGVAQVVFQHPVGAVAVAHQVDAGHQAASPHGDRHVHRLPLEAGTRGD